MICLFGRRGATWADLHPPLIQVMAGCSKKSHACIILTQSNITIALPPAAMQQLSQNPPGTSARLLNKALLTSIRDPLRSWNLLRFHYLSVKLSRKIFSFLQKSSDQPLSHEKSPVVVKLPVPTQPQAQTREITGRQVGLTTKEFFF